MTSGYGVYYDYRTNNGGSNNGYSVKFAADHWTDGAVRNGLAGVVSGGKIYPGGFGPIQIWGHCEHIVVGGQTNGFAALWNSITSQIIADADLQNLYLEPIDQQYYSTSPGLFAVVLIANATNRQGYSPVIQIVDAVIPSGSTTYGTLANTSTGTTKAFIRCL